MSVRDRGHSPKKDKHSGQTPTGPAATPVNEAESESVAETETESETESRRTRANPNANPA